MEILFAVLGAIDLIAGGILFFQPTILVKLIGALIFTKGIVTIIKSL